MTGDILSQKLLASTPMVVEGCNCQLRLVVYTGQMDGSAEKEFRVVLTAPQGHVVLDVGYTLEEGVSFYVGYQLEDSETLLERLMSSDSHDLTVVKEVAHE